jgi:cyclopropane fatty-acyl-phospholipid synthase-like methyltransferase
VKNQLLRPRETMSSGDNVVTIVSRLRELARKVGARRALFRLIAWAVLPLRRGARLLEHIAPEAVGRWLYRREWLWQPMYGSAFLERFYKQDDPFHFNSNPYEAAKYEHTLAALGDEHFEQALEMGCSVGTFTKLLAGRVGHVLAVDISERALDQARELLSGAANVTLERRMLPHEMPTGPFDLIVCSDVLYYWPEDVLVDALPRFASALNPGGVLLVVHFLGKIGLATQSQRVHDLLREKLPLDHEMGETVPNVGPQDAGYRLDRFRKPRLEG